MHLPPVNTWLHDCTAGCQNAGLHASAASEHMAACVGPSLRRPRGAWIMPCTASGSARRMTPGTEHASVGTKVWLTAALWPPRRRVLRMLFARSRAPPAGRACHDVAPVRVRRNEAAQVGRRDRERAALARRLQQLQQHAQHLRAVPARVRAARQEPAATAARSCDDAGCRPPPVCAKHGCMSYMHRLAEPGGPGAGPPRRRDPAAGRRALPLRRSARPGRGGGKGRLG